MDVKTVVAEALAAKGETVKIALVNHFVDKEISSRTEQLIRAVVVIDNLEKELSKEDKPDIVSINSEGVRTANWSEKKFNDVKAKKEKLANIKTLFDVCLDKNLKEDYDKLSKLIGGGKQEVPQQDSDKSV